MRVRPSFTSVRPHFGAAVIATLAVVVFPAVATGAFVRAADTRPSPLVTAFISVMLGLLISTAGAAWWSRRPQSKEIGFGELMLWGWWRRKRAEDKLVAGTRSLGLDATGRPAGTVEISREDQVQVLKDLTTALESKDLYTHGHSRRVERHCYRTAAAMGLAIADIEELRRAAALHDVGKVRVPDLILRKAGPLTADERAVIEEHSIVGAWMVSTVGSANVVSAVRHHHERWDGRGYPDGLARHEIPLYSRIISVADAYDAMTSTRPYRAGMSRDEAVAILHGDSGTHFDPNVVECFVASLPDRAAVASLLALLALPGGALRRMAVTAKRVGMANVAPALGATGAAVIIGTGSLVAPSPPTDPRAPARADADHSLSVTGPQTGVLSAPHDGAPAKPGRPMIRRSAVRGVAPSALVLGERLSAPRSTAQGESPGSGVGPAQSTGSRTGAPPPAPEAAEQHQPPAHEEPGSVEQASAEEQPAEKAKKSDSNARRDPQPEKGKDCPREEKQKGDAKGHEYHCDD